MGLRSYIITRILLTIPMMLLLISIVFLVVRVLPGDPVLLHFGKNASPELIEQVRHEMGLDKPLWVQYFDYISGLLHGDLGKSMYNVNENIGPQISSAFPATLELAIFSLAIAIVIGVLLGIRSSRSYNSAQDHLIRVSGIIAYALPSFFLGMVFQLVFGVWLHWFPTGGRTSVGMEPFGLSIGGFRLSTGLYTIDSLLEGNMVKFFEALRYLFLPSLALGLVLCGPFIRLTRNTMLDTLNQDFITSAKARGLKEKTVVYEYAFRNAFLPVLTMMGLSFAGLLGGAVLTETTFSRMGLGRYIVERIYFRDYTAIQGAVAAFGILASLVSLAIDLLYAYLDPRIRF